MARPHFTEKQIRAAFFEKVSPEPNSGCWLWTGAADTRGYGKIGIHGRTRAAHRVAYEWLVGTVPDGLFLLHRCDTPACVNPDHLRPGTQADNIHDMHAKGRAALGEALNCTRLTPAEVLGIRFLFLLGRKQNVMARQYGVSPMTIHRVVTGELWKHLPEVTL